MVPAWWWEDVELSTWRIEVLWRRGESLRSVEVSGGFGRGGGDGDRGGVLWRWWRCLDGSVWDWNPKERSGEGFRREGGLGIGLVVLRCLGWKTVLGGGTSVARIRGDRDQ
ncbi:hypothetical protein KC19_5G074100 [Ceratodon purpureus]|uniref:Uncharacterized protein n=1 Tax=Ceratodon purpureus TaxID=3225 RepID=A0A8T0HYV1_CERPU|nr:hypothetical protein KC19_5G074100 [Ceratodon purpureus]